MAKVTSTIFSSMSGSIAGITYFHGPHNAILARSRTIPVNPNSVYQQLVRQAMNLASQSWDLLTDLQRILWQEYCDLSAFKFSGRAAFIAAHSMCGYLGNRFPLELFGAPSAPPGIYGYFNAGNIGSHVLSAPGIGFAISISNNELVPAKIEFCIAGPFNPTKNYFKGPYPASGVSIEDIALSTSAVFDFDGLVTGKVYFVRVRVIDATNWNRWTTKVHIRAVASTVI